MDRLSTLISNFGVRAGVFHSGGMCGLASYGVDAHDGGHLHLLRSGEVALVTEDGVRQKIVEPSLIFFPRRNHHQLLSGEADRTELVCGSLSFDGGHNNPLVAALPEFLVLPTKSLSTLELTLNWLFAEAFGEHCGRLAVMDRLFELLVIQLLRHVLEHRLVSFGMLAGLGDPRLARALNVIHNQPGEPWTVESLASTANMSRANFAAQFREVVGQSPADYLLDWRIGLAQKRLRDGQPIARVAEEVGYDSASALARAFRRKTGSSPRDWLRAQMHAVTTLPRPRVQIVPALPAQAA
ncbi:MULTISPECIES: AraC family transcriptional regulator [Pandoraea]|uniref:AraC family transcriptional regulator n=1 Tax=Pandoraea TaxID=93217 RepID=UPI001F5C3F26|nr:MULTISPECIES: AraC family transcriptional regulator [Pandoraea]MCI3205933.1 AraC family transcriptional regulator [Pandoraea sp. LA3]MDN4583961.1 AraC family transcriptional regulator [Pandoraea capi]